QGSSWELSVSLHRLVDVDYTSPTKRCQPGLATLRHPYGERARYMVVSVGARRILVVDDDPMVATTVQRVLRPEGYEVDVALGEHPAGCRPHHGNRDRRGPSR